jgi:hypothetical protein
MFDQQQKWTDEPCFYVTAVDGITRIALLAGPYPTKEVAERVVAKASAWAIDESGDLKAVFYAYGVSKRNHGHDRSILGMIEP